MTGLMEARGKGLEHGKRGEGAHLSDISREGNHGMDTLGMAVENLAVLAAHVLVLPGVLFGRSRTCSRIVAKCEAPTVPGLRKLSGWRILCSADNTLAGHCPSHTGTGLTLRRAGRRSRQTALLINDDSPDD